MSGALRSRWTLVALLIVGCGLMLPFEYWATRLLGMACLFGFIVLGVFLIAEPGFLGADEDHRETRGRSEGSSGKAAG